MLVQFLCMFLFISRSSGQGCKIGSAAHTEQEHTFTYHYFCSTDDCDILLQNTFARKIFDTYPVFNRFGNTFNI